MPRTRYDKTNTNIIRDVDKVTGEVIGESRQDIQKSYTVSTPTEEFFQVYCKFIAHLYSLHYADDIKILMKFCEIAEYNTGKVLLPAPERKKMCEEMQMQTSNVSKALKRLRDKKLIDGEQGSYTINPAIFWKGEQKIRTQLLKEGALSVIFNFKTE